MKEQETKRLVSIIIPIYNNSRYVYDCLDSVLQQDYPQIELILADDGSETDDSAEIMEFVSGKKKDNITNVRFLRSEENRGTVYNINHAIEQAKGSYIVTLAADDTLFDQTVLTDWVNVFQESGADVVVGFRQGCDENLNPKFVAPDRKRAKVLKAQDAPRVWKELCRENFIFGCATARSMQCIRKYGPVPGCYKLIEDHPMNLRWVRLGAKVVLADRMVVRHRNGGVSYAANISESYIADMKAIYENEVIPYVKHKQYWRLHMRRKIRLRVRESRYINMRKKSDSLLWNVFCHIRYPEIIVKYLRKLNEDRKQKQTVFTE